MTQETYLQQGRQLIRKLRSDHRVQKGTKFLCWGAAGGLLSALGLAGYPQPFALGMICNVTGWRALAAVLGSLLGYRGFWGTAGAQGMVWSLAGALGALLPEKCKPLREGPMLLPAAASLTVSLAGLVFQMAFGDETSVAVYLLRILVGGGSVFLGGRIMGGRLPGKTGEVLSGRFDVGAAQVRLEIMSGVLRQTQQLLLETAPTPIDEEAVLARTRERACGGCPNRKTCGESGRLTTELLHLSLVDTSVLRIPCRKPNRLLLELRRSQEQLRLHRGELARRQECRQAVVQQYGFLSTYLQQTADTLNRRREKLRIHYRAEVQIATLAREPANGDRCQGFAGVGGTYYVLLCDGMGTGLGAAQESQRAMTMLRQMLIAGFPAQHALTSVNALCCLRGRAGAVTLDLAEICLDTGRVVVYKWGAAPSVLVRTGMAEKIGTAGPPPGLEMEGTRETVDRLSLRRGEVLILLSDGVAAEKALRCAGTSSEAPLGEYAAELLERCAEDGSDDATVAAIRLHPTSLST